MRAHAAKQFIHFPALTHPLLMSPTPPHPPALGQHLAQDAARLQPANYPLHYPCALRYSDLDGSVVSRVAVAHIFEELRTGLGRDVLGQARKEYEQTHGRWQSLMRSVEFEFLAEADANQAIKVCGGMAAVGRTSHRMAMAMFQDGRCVALGESTNVTIVTVGNSRRPAPVPEPMRRAMTTAMLRDVTVAAARPDPAALPAWEVYPFTYELPTRFADTDAVGHINNVAVSRYHDNAFMAFQHGVLGRYSRPGDDGHWRVARHVVAMPAENFHRQPMFMGLAVCGIHAHHFTLQQALYQQGKNTGTALMQVACVGAAGQPQPLPAALREALAPWCVKTL